MESSTSKVIKYNFKQMKNFYLPSIFEDSCFLWRRPEFSFDAGFVGVPWLV